MEKKVYFQVCDCGGKIGTHGYFYTPMGRCPWPTASMEAAEPMIKSYVEDFQLTTDEANVLRAELVAAQLPVEMSRRERTLLVDYGVQSGLVNREDQMRSDLFRALDELFGG